MGFLDLPGQFRITINVACLFGRECLNSSKLPSTLGRGGDQVFSDFLF